MYNIRKLPKKKLLNLINSMHTGNTFLSSSSKRLKRIKQNSKQEILL